MAIATQPQMWAALTVDEADVLGAVLKAGAVVAVAADERANHALFMETFGVIADVREAGRRRWNAEHPDNPIGQV